MLETCFFLFWTIFGYSKFGWNFNHLDEPSGWTICMNLRFWWLMQILFWGNWHVVVVLGKDHFNVWVSVLQDIHKKWGATQQEAICCMMFLKNSRFKGHHGNPSPRQTLAELGIYAEVVDHELRMGKKTGPKFWQGNCPGNWKNFGARYLGVQRYLGPWRKPAVHVGFRPSDLDVSKEPRVHPTAHKKLWFLSRHVFPICSLPTFRRNQSRPPRRCRTSTSGMVHKKTGSRHGKVQIRWKKVR